MYYYTISSKIQVWKHPKIAFKSDTDETQVMIYPGKTALQFQTSHIMYVTVSTMQEWGRHKLDTTTLRGESQDEGPKQVRGPKQVPSLASQRLLDTVIFGLSPRAFLLLKDCARSLWDPTLSIREVRQSSSFHCSSVPFSASCPCVCSGS